jgi:hypothetical protein
VGGCHIMVDNEKDAFEEIEEEECERHKWNSKFNKVDGNGDVIELELGPKLKESGIVTSFALQRRVNNLVLSLNHKYDDVLVVYSIKTRDWQKMIDNFEKRLIKKGVSEEHARQLSDVLDHNYEIILNLKGDSHGNNNNNNNSTDSKVEPVTCSEEEWRTKLVQKYQNLHDVAEKNLPGLWHSLEFDLSVKNILHIKDCSLPFAGIVLGSPSSKKTVGIHLLKKSRHVYYTHHFSPRAFVSHISGLTEEELQQNDLLPKIRNKCLLTPELAPTFAAKDDDLVQFIGILTSILDGHGYESDSGAHGHRGYDEDMMFTWIGASVHIPPKVYKLLTTLGPKLYFLRAPKTEQKSADDYYKQLQDNDFDAKLSEIQKALTDYQDWFEACPVMVSDDKFNSDIRKMPWISSDDDGPDGCQKAAFMHIIELGKLLAHLRGVVPALYAQDMQSSEYSYGIPIIEEPDRAMRQLANLAMGHALQTGRNYVSAKDLPQVIKVVLSTAPIERVVVFDILLANGGKLTTNQIIDFLATSRPTAIKTMTEFKALGLVDMEEKLIDGKYTMQITLKKEFDWFLKEEFNSLREGFEPTDDEDDHEGEDEDDIASDMHKEKFPLEKGKKNNDSGNSDNDCDKDNTNTLLSGGKNSLRRTNQKHNSYFNKGSGKWHCSNCKESGDRFHMEDTECPDSKK